MFTYLGKPVIFFNKLRAQRAQGIVILAIYRHENSNHYCNNVPRVVKNKDNIFTTEGMSEQKYWYVTK